MPMPSGARAAAIAAGFNTYRTGKRCKRGHIDVRWTKSGVCMSCNDMPRVRDRRKKKVAK